MIIAESLLDKRDCTAAEIETEQSSQAPCLASLVFSICLLRPRGEGSPVRELLLLRSLFQLAPFFLSLSFCPSLFPPFFLSSPFLLFLGRISWWLPLFASLSILLSPRHSLLHRRENPTTSTGRHDYLWQLRGEYNLPLRMPPRFLFPS